MRLIYRVNASSRASNHFLDENQTVGHAVGEQLRGTVLLAALVQIAGRYVDASEPRVQSDVLQLLQNELADLRGAGEREGDFARIGSVTTGDFHVIMSQDVADHLVHVELG